MEVAFNASRCGLRMRALCGLAAILFWVALTAVSVPVVAGTLPSGMDAQGAPAWTEESEQRCEGPALLEHARTVLWQAAAQSPSPELQVVAAPSRPALAGAGLVRAVAWREAPVVFSQFLVSSRMRL